MKRNSKIFLMMAFISALLFVKIEAAEPLKVGTVNLKEIGDKSKFGKHERETFEAMEKQMDAVLKEKEKKLADLAEKLKDELYLDSISAEAETELKRESRSLGQEFMQLRNQYVQTIQQANMMIMQKLSDIITKSSEKVAKEKKLDLIINESMTYFATSTLDITDPIIIEMDKIWEEEIKESKISENTANEKVNAMPTKPRLAKEK